jgi:hypothetical protein
MFSPEERSALGLEAEDAFEVVSEPLRASDPVARGLLAARDSAAEAYGLERLLDRIRAEPDLGALHELADTPLGGRVFAWKRDPAVLILQDIRGSVRTSGGTQRLRVDAWLIDGRGVRAAIRFSHSGGDWVLTGEQGAVRVLRVIARRQDPLNRLPSPAPEPVQLPPVALEDILSRVEIASWLLDAIQSRLADKRPLERVIALGLLARHAGRTAKDSGSLLDEMLRGIPGPRERALAWARSALVSGVHNEILQAATNEAHLLGTSLDELRAAVAAERADVSILASDVRQQRERLEAVREMLEAVQQNGALDAILRGIDDQALDDAVSFLLSGTDNGGDLLASVACIDPDAWWGVDPR